MTDPFVYADNYANKFRFVHSITKMEFFDCGYSLGKGSEWNPKGNSFIFSQIQIYEKYYPGLDFVSFFKELINIFNPDQIDTLTSIDYGKGLPFENGYSTCTSGIVYMSKKYDFKWSDLDEFEVINILDKGNIILVTPDGKFDRENLEHRNKAQKVWDIINRDQVIKLA